MFNFNGNGYYGAQEALLLTTGNQDSVKTAYRIDNSVATHRWFDPANGTTERMRIHTTGNIGIDNQSPGYKLQFGGTTGLAVDTEGLLGDATDSTVGVTAGGENLRLRTSGSGSIKFAVGSSEKARIDSSGNLLVGRTSASAAATDHGWQAYNTGIVYQYADAATNTDVHRWYNGAGSLVASINARGEGFFLGGATYSGPLKADEIIQDGAPVVDSLQIIRAFMKLRAATADPDSTVEELREKLKTAVDDIIDQFQDQIDNMPTPLED
jgi:hypothetical protein